jgi:ADP-heptose:LPS heptosyltransferase
MKLNNSMNRIKGFIYDLITLFASIGKRNKNDTEKVLLIRVDEIGDYLLWRKFIFELLESSLCKHKEVHFVGNNAWKTLFELEFTNNPFVKIYWLNKTLFKKSIIYRFRFSRSIFNAHYSAVINPTYSRAKRVDDSIVKAAKSNSNYGFVRNNENYLYYEQSYDRNLYNYLLPVNQKPIFELNRNKAFTEWISQNKSLISDSLLSETIILPEVKTKHQLPDNYFVLFPGSRSAKRIWNAQNFSVVANYLFEKYKFTLILAGAPSDKLYGTAFVNIYQHSLINLIGNTSLPETLAILKGAKCILSVDTGSIHLAASVNALCVGIFNGSQYGRFSPYPNSISNKIISIYPTSIANEISNTSIINEKYEHIVSIDYNEVTALQVIDRMEKENLV